MSGKALSTHLALLRGINVGGKNMLPMKELVEIFLDVGCSDVRTYIQSGNVIFNAPPRLLESLRGAVEQRIAAQFGYQIPIVLRTASQLAEAIGNNPFLKPGADLPTPQAIAKLDPERSRPDTFVVHNREVYLHLPNGVAGTKVTNSYFDSKLATVSTGRNWATVLKLLELMKQL